MRLALQGFVDVFNVLPRSDLNSLEISCSTFHSIVSIHMNDVCLISVGFVRAEQQLGHIFIDGEAKFRAIDEGHTDAAPVGQKQFRANVYVLLQWIVSKCFVKKLWINDLAHLDDVAFKALIAIQPNVGNVTLVCMYGVSSYGEEFILLTLGLREMKFCTMGKGKAGGSAR